MSSFVKKYTKLWNTGPQFSPKLGTKSEVTKRKEYTGGWGKEGTNTSFLTWENLVMEGRGVGVSSSPSFGFCLTYHDWCLESPPDKKVLSAIKDLANLVNWTWYPVSWNGAQIRSLLHIHSKLGMKKGVNPGPQTPVHEHT